MPEVPTEAPAASQSLAFFGIFRGLWSKSLWIEFGTHTPRPKSPEFSAGHSAGTSTRPTHISGAGSRSFYGVYVSALSNSLTASLPPALST